MSSYTSLDVSMANVIRPRMMRQGMGVRALTLTSAMERGMCPFRAPTKKMRADAKMTPLMHPKVEQATKSGISHAITPIVREAKVTATALDARISVGVSTAK